MPSENPFRDYDVVRVVTPAASEREFQGSPNVTRAPEVGDVGTIVFAYGPANFAVECVNRDGLTVWLADFSASELDRVVRDDSPAP